MRILVVEDDVNLNRQLSDTLKEAGYVVDQAFDGEEGHFLGDTEPYDAIILDIGLPELDGVSVLEKWRGAGRGMPVLILTARDRWSDKVAGIDAGADDYVTKPFGMDELLARLRAAVRRAEPTGGGEDDVVVDTEDFTVDLAAKKVNRAGRDVRLTPTEWHLLEVLVRNTGRLVSQKQLLQEVWGPSYGTETNYLRVYMAQLRRKLEVDPSHPRHFITEPGMGYRFEK
jgi:two-component system KDP operon response regulator KdpE